MKKSERKRTCLETEMCERKQNRKKIKTYNSNK